MSVTEIIAVDPQRPDPDVIAGAAQLLRKGGLVAFPTETVYGLGACATDAAAVRRLFKAKGRPPRNPVIVHVADKEQARELVAEWPEAAERLAGRFWPGPLTLVLPKRDVIPEEVTAGARTVGIRVPAHPVALALLQAAGIPVAAPSANRSSEISPTRAEHVRRGLDGRIHMILDGGPCSGGLESTVLDLTASPPRLLRPGLVTPAQLDAVLGTVIRPSPAIEAGTHLASPGLLSRHYAPRTPLECVEEDAYRRAGELAAQGGRIALLSHRSDPRPAFPRVTMVSLPDEPTAYAARLYAVLHELDQAGLARILVDMPPPTEDWLAVRDRLRRAGHATDDP